MPSYIKSFKWFDSYSADTILWWFYQTGPCDFELWPRDPGLIVSLRFSRYSWQIKRKSFKGFQSYRADKILWRTVWQLRQKQFIFPNVLGKHNSVKCFLPPVFLTNLKILATDIDRCTWIHVVTEPCITEYVDKELLCIVWRKPVHAVSEISE